MEKKEWSEVILHIAVIQMFENDTDQGHFSPAFGMLNAFCTTQGLDNGFGHKVTTLLDRLGIPLKITPAYYFLLGHTVLFFLWGKEGFYICPAVMSK